MVYIVTSWPRLNSTHSYQLILPVMVCLLPILTKDRFVSCLAPVSPGIFKLVKKCNLVRLCVNV